MPSKELTGDQEIQAPAKDQAIRWLMHELKKGRQSGDEQGWLSIEEVERQLGVSSKQS